MVNLDGPIPSDPHPRSELSGRYVYCITFGLEPGSFCRAGIDHRPVYPLSQDGLSALVHDCRPEPYHGDTGTVERWRRAHALVAEAAWETAGAVLPMPFNVVLCAQAPRSADSRLRTWLRRNQEAARLRLERLRGKVELEVRLLWNGVVGNDTGARPDRSLEAKVKRALHESIRAHAGDVTPSPARPWRGRQTLLDVSVLVAREKASRLGEELAAIGAHAGLEVVCNGPRLPYSFAPEVALADERQTGDR